MGSFFGRRVFLINSLDGYEQIDFEFGGKSIHRQTQIELSCSLQWHNHFYVFGGFGQPYSELVSMVNGNRLERKARLDFRFSWGACTVLNQQTIVLCFSDSSISIQDENKLCRQSNHPHGSFTELPKSYHDHAKTRIASFDGKNTIDSKIETLQFR